MSRKTENQTDLHPALHPALSPHQIHDIEISTIHDADRSRRDMGDIESLMASIEAHGLIQPIVVRHDGELVVGGRRLEAYRQLGRTTIKGIYKEELSDEALLLLEAEENLQRKDFDWKELVTHIARIWRLKTRSDTGERWTRTLIAKTLKVSQSYVSIALFLERELRETPDGPVASASSMWDAFDVLTRQREDEARAELQKRIASRMSVQANDRPDGPPADPHDDQPDGAPTEELAPEEAETQKELSMRLERLWQGDAIELIPKMAARWDIHHIITDPPYGQDMANMSLNTEKVDRTRDEHQVESNLQLIEAFLETSYHAIHPAGFLVMWYTLEHHEKIRDWARKIGWRVQEWPFVWCKTSYCMNKASQYNMTSKVETCFLMRHSASSILATHQGDNYMVADNPRSDHAFFKPLPIWNRLINAVSMEGQNILDPFCGEGSALKAILSAARMPMGIELKEEHYNIAYEAMERMVLRQRELDLEEEEADDLEEEPDDPCQIST